MLKFISIIALTFGLFITAYAQTDTVTADETAETETVDWTFE